jgi:copper chaperone CopZ
MEFSTTWEKLSELERTEDQKIKFLCESIDRLEAALLWNIEIVNFRVRSNQQHQHLRNKNTLDMLTKCFNAVKRQIPNVKDSQLNADLDAISTTFQEKVTALRESDTKELDALEKIAARIYAKDEITEQ